MTRIPFDPNHPILLFDCEIEFKTKHTLTMALDSGASCILISEAAAIEIGFDIERIERNTTFGNASQSHLVPKVRLKSFSLGNAKVEDIEALCYTIPEEHGIDGVIGLNFLRHFKVILDFQKGILTLERYLTQAARRNLSPDLRKTARTS